MEWKSTDELDKKPSNENDSEVILQDEALFGWIRV